MLDFNDKFPTNVNPLYIPLKSLDTSLLLGGDPQELDLAKLFPGETVVFTAAPGAFTPTCTQAHIPDYLKHEKQLKDKGVARVIILCQNDAFVMNAWAKAEGYNADENYFVFASDPNLGISSQLGSDYTLNLKDKGLGERTLRWAAIVKDGKIQFLGAEPDGKYGNVVGINHILKRI
ncbi:peroxiredoxin [Kocuria palustris]|nr:peroxiredoxin [Kocuria palustris]